MYILWLDMYIIVKALKHKCVLSEIELHNFANYSKHCFIIPQQMQFKKGNTHVGPFVAVTYHVSYVSSTLSYVPLIFVSKWHQHYIYI